MQPRPLDPWPEFLRTTAWIGLNSFGGPIAQIGFTHHHAVERRRWVSEEQFVQLLSFANVLPGPEALELVIHLGYLRRGRLGGLIAGLLLIWPGFVSVTALAWLYPRYGASPWVSGFFSGVRPVAVALIAYAAMRLSSKALTGAKAYAVMVAAFLANFVFSVPFTFLLAGAGLLGLWAGRPQGIRLGRWQQPLALTVLVAALAAGFSLKPNVPPPRQRGRAQPPARHCVGQHQGCVGDLRGRVHIAPLPPRANGGAVRLGDGRRGERRARARGDDPRSTGVSAGRLGSSPRCPLRWCLEASPASSMPPSR